MLAAVGAIAVIVGLLIFFLDISQIAGVSNPQFGIGLAALPGYALIALMAGQFRARGRIRAGQWPDSILVPIVAMVVIQAAQTAGQTSLFWLLAAHTAAVWCAAVTYWLLSRSHLSGQLVRPAADEVRNIRQTSLTIAFSGGISVLSNRLPLIFVSAIIGTPAAALYEAAQRIGALGSLGTWAAGTAVSPMLSDAHARNQKSRLQDLLIASSWIAFLPALMIFLGLIPGGGLVLSLFGADYAAAHGALVVLAGLIVINASAGLTSHTFNMTGHEAIVLRFNLAQLTTIVFMAPLLTHLAGITGTTFAVLISVIVRDVGMGFLLPGKLGLAPGVWSRVGAARAFGLAWAKMKGR